MSGMFAGIDMNEISDDPFKIDDGTYEAVVEDVKVGPTRDGSKNGMTIVFSIKSPEAAGNRVQRWMHIPEAANTDEEKRSLSFLKKAIIDLGVSPDEVNTVEPSDLIGREVNISVVTRDNFPNVKKCEPLAASGGFGS